jgi:RHS repeat-associated protein
LDSRSARRLRRRLACSRATGTTTAMPDWHAGVSFLNNRYHDPTLGRFISVDPLVNVTHDAYGYGNNNPISYSDPSGLCATNEFGICQSGEGSGSASAPGPNRKAGAAGPSVAGYIAGEMGTNRSNSNVRGLRDLSDSQQCTMCDEGGGSKVLYLLYLKRLGPVLQTGGAWDHKKPIVALAGATSDSDFVDMGNGYKVRIDVFSNVHYGYIFKFAGVTDQDSLDYSHGDYGGEVGGIVAVWNHLPFTADIHLPNPGNQSDMVNRRQDDAAIRVGQALCHCGYGAGGFSPPSTVEVIDAIVSDKTLRDLGVVLPTR